MLLSIESFPFREKFGEEKALRMIRDAGFDGVDYSFNAYNSDGSWGAINLENYITHAKEVKALLDKYGLKVNQSHAPFCFKYGDRIGLDGKHFADVVRSIEFASIIGAESIVIHAIKAPEEVDFFQYNYDYYKSYEPYAEKFHIKIAIENLRNSEIWKPEKLSCFIKSLKSPVFCACVDVGHAAIMDIPPEQFIDDMDVDLIQYIHMHDTDGEVDRHWIPYLGIHNWDEIIKSLVRYGFDGDMNLEVIHSFDNLPDELYQPMLNYTAIVGRELKEKFNQYKREII